MNRMTMTAIGALALVILPVAAQEASDTFAPQMMGQQSMVPSAVDPVLNPDELDNEVEQGTDVATEFDDASARGGLYFEDKTGAETSFDTDLSMETEYKDSIETDMEIDSELDAEFTAPETN